MKKTNLYFFYQSELKVTQNVFRPRPETEQLIDLTKEYAEYWISNQKAEVLEIGTGSGGIAINWAKIYPQNKITATDIDPRALKCAQQNILENNVNCELVFSDLFSNINQKYDLIIANLPYIAENDSFLSPEVKANDPGTALYGGKDGLKILRLFFAEVKHYLKKRFLISLEIGFNQKKALKKIIQTFLPAANFHFEKDYSGCNRFLFIYNAP